MHTMALQDIDTAVAQACARIAPTWPLDRFIAVSPFWAMTERPLIAVAAELRALSGARLLMPRAWYREALRQGMMREEDLAQALAQSGSSTTLAQLAPLLDGDEIVVPMRLRVGDVIDAERDLAHEVSWRDFVTHSISQYCASYFDDGQAVLTPDRTGGLYASWRRLAVSDRSPALLMGLRNYRELVRGLPPMAKDMIGEALSTLGIEQGQRVSYFCGLLLDSNGWSSWCAYRRWTSRLAGSDDDTLTELLAIRLAWESTLLRSGDPSLASRWQLAMRSWPGLDAFARDAQQQDWIFQKAIEIAWQRTVIADLPKGLATPAPKAPAVQAAFCIDVRSEVFRRALEAQNGAVQTIGFAGFFGMPIEYLPLGTHHARPQLPGLLAPRLRVTETAMPEGAAARRLAALEAADDWKALPRDAASTFAFVEAMGLLSGVKLISDIFGLAAGASAEDVGLSSEDRTQRKLRLGERIDGTQLSPTERCDLAAGLLVGMSLTHDFARLVLLTGHRSQTTNNPHAAGLDCGACGGQSGEINARVAASLLNEESVHEGLCTRGILIPSTTRFVAGLHNTTTDDVTLFDVDELPASHGRDLEELVRWLASAATHSRKERAVSFGLAGSSPEVLHAAARERARDWAQLRPEWGLANNAAFIVAPREHTRHLNLGGRAFLHDYRFEEDKHGQVLELIMTAPMVVTHWINMQYYASTVDNVRYGSGNKVLHNVVGGHLGVFEGNGGDLRIGLPMQSLHDGQRWVHTPLRLSVFIEAPVEAIERVLRKHEKVNELVRNGWLDLFQIDVATGLVTALHPGQ